jgi:CMP-N-acetylneuraminic acid synthetase
MLRPFGGTTLARLALETITRSREVDTVYFAAHEEELLAIASEFPSVRIIRRTRESALGEDARTIWNFLEEVEEPIIAKINACCPFLRTETYDEAIREFRAGDHVSLLPVVESREWYFDEQGRPLNAPDPSIINSKVMPIVYRYGHAFTLFHKDRFLKDYRVWSFQPGDPHLRVIAPEEAIDINTELEFEVAEALYVARFGGGGREALAPREEAPRVAP